MATPSGITLAETSPLAGEDQGGSVEDEDNPFRPSKDLRVEDQTEQDEKKMPPPAKPAPTGPQAQSGPKISFALKSKALPAPATTPATDLLQKMKDPPQKVVKPAPRPAPTALNSKLKTESRYERSYDSRSDRRSDYRYSESRPSRKSDARTEPRAEPRAESRTESRPEPPRTEKKIMKRMKPRPTLPPELAASISVYYRKPGNESVVGSGTFGKVFKAVHVYTKDMVALKKIRMEGERDGVSRPCALQQYSN